MWQYFPEIVLKATKYTPAKIYARLRKLNAMFADIGRPLMKSTIEGWDDSRNDKRDVLSVLSEPIPLFMLGLWLTFYPPP